MYKLIMEKQCGCFKKSDFEAEQIFESEEEALKKAKQMCEYMNEQFCQKHEFSISEEKQGNDIIIKVDFK